MDYNEEGRGQEVGDDKGDERRTATPITTMPVGFFLKRSQK